MLYNRTKYIDIKVHFTRDVIFKGVLKQEKVATQAKQV